MEQNTILVILIQQEVFISYLEKPITIFFLSDSFLCLKYLVVMFGYY